MDLRYNDQQLDANIRAWQDHILAEHLRRGPVRKQEYRTGAGISIEAVYFPRQAPAESYDEWLGFPGEHPFTRGVYPNMYRGRLWTMRQYAGFGTCEETNQRFKYLLDQGQTGLSVAFDLPILLHIRGEQSFYFNV